MDANDQRAIRSLFERLASVEEQSPPRDPEAEAFIDGEMRRLPGAPYYMAQTIVAQEQALAAAQGRIAELEGEAAPSRGGFFGEIFGREERPARPRTSVPPVARGRGGMNSPASGGFLAGAAQTAMGVAGGILIGNAIGGLFGSNEAQAQEQSAANDSATDETSIDDSGDVGDFGDF